MSSSQENGTTIVCREVFDEASHPSNEEVLDYAKRLGIDPDAEPHLLDLAREGLMAALPKTWKPVFHETTGAWYYYHTTTKTTSWEHPLDAKYRELVEQARAGRSRQHSIDEDSKTTAKDLESHEDATLPKEPPISKVPVLQTKIPTKLAPLKKVGLETSRRRDCKRNAEAKSANATTLLTDRNSRDYTNVRFQDPKFYESPGLLKSPEREINLREIVKRSESMSPRYEKDWEQLSSKFSSEENVIDIDKLSASSLTKSESKSQLEKTEDEKPCQMGQQKELVLSGGGSMFLKSNRSRDTTPSHDGGKIEDFHVANIASDTTERPKSILREKPYEDDDRPTEEERKSVRFDLEKGPEDIKFLYSGSEDNDWDSDSMDRDSHQVKRESFFATLKQRLVSHDLQLKAYQSEKMFQPSQESVEHSDVSDGSVTQRNESEEITPLNSATTPKMVGRRFLVQNVSELEHMSQIAREDSNDDYFPVNKFANIKNIDIFPKTDSDSITRTSGRDSKSSLDDIRRSKEIMLEAMRLSDQRSKRDRDETPQRSEEIEDIIREIGKQHEIEISKLKEAFEEKLEKTRTELEEHFVEQRECMEQEVEDKLAEVRRQLAQKEKDEIQKLVTEMDAARAENLEKMRTELELCYEKEKQDILEKLKVELDERRKELLELRNREMQVLENEFEATLDEEKALKMAEQEITQRHNEQIDALKRELEKEFDELKNTLRTQQREKVTKITEDHEKCLADIFRDFRVDERLARKVFKQRLEEIRSDLSRGIDKEAKKISEQVSRQETVDFEKIRCEKRLLEDKYKTLKEKYLKLKNDVRLAVEKRSRPKEGNTTASETERSASTRTRTDRTESTDQKTLSKNLSSNSRSIDGQNQNATDESEGKRPPPGFRRIGDLRSSSKFESDDTTTASETMNSDLLKKRKSFAKKPSNSKTSHSNTNNNNASNNNGSMENPVENIRKQLEKLEDLGDQLPSNETAYTLRYPFQDKAPINASSELEFFRHRIHVERDSVKRAREALRVQRNIFQGRQRAWKQRSARATLEQLVQEERELSEMEVSLHRTRSLLGEKVIHLKHLEQSLERVVNAKKNENQTTPVKNDEQTLSDMSSASSGFSSTDLGTDTFPDKPDHYQESTEIIASLENLNSEIREIWGVLNKRQGNNIPPPPTLSYSDLGWFPYQHVTTQANNVQSFGTPNIQSNILSQLTATLPSTTTQNIIAQYGPNSGFTTSVGTVERGPSNLIERTRNMRDWLRQARMESTDLISPGQATL